MALNTIRYFQPLLSVEIFFNQLKADYDTSKGFYTLNVGSSDSDADSFDEMSPSAKRTSSHKIEFRNRRFSNSSSGYRSHTSDADSGEQESEDSSSVNTDNDSNDDEISESECSIIESEGSPWKPNMNGSGFQRGGVESSKKRRNSERKLRFLNQRKRTADPIDTDSECSETVGIKRASRPKRTRRALSSSSENESISPQRSFGRNISKQVLVPKREFAFQSSLVCGFCNKFFSRESALKGHLLLCSALKENESPGKSSTCSFDISPVKRRLKRPEYFKIPKTHLDDLDSNMPSNNNESASNSQLDISRTDKLVDNASQQIEVSFLSRSIPSDEDDENGTVDGIFKILNQPSDAGEKQLENPSDLNFINLECSQQHQNSALKSSFSNDCKSSDRGAAHQRCPLCKMQLRTGLEFDLHMVAHLDKAYIGTETKKRKLRNANSFENLKEETDNSWYSSFLKMSNSTQKANCSRELSRLSDKNSKFQPLLVVEELKCSHCDKTFHRKAAFEAHSKCHDD